MRSLAIVGDIQHISSKNAVDIRYSESLTIHNIGFSIALTTVITAGIGVLAVLCTMDRASGR